MFNKLTKSYLINSLVDVHDLLFTHPDLKKNVELKDKYNNERIFILGSGSSMGVPRPDGFFGDCNPKNKKNYNLL